MHVPASLVTLFALLLPFLLLAGVFMAVTGAAWVLCYAVYRQLRHA